MKAKFYYNKSDKRYLNKTIEVKFDGTNHAGIDIQMLEPSSVIRPSIKVSSGLIGKGVNYVWIEDLERYYYIKDWIMDDGYIRMDLEVDVLMSFKDAITQKNVILSRQEKTYNLYHVDDKYQLINTKATKIVEFPTNHFSMNNAQFILALTGSAVGHV